MNQLPPVAAPAVQPHTTSADKPRASPVGSGGLFRSATFRLALIYVFLFSISVGVLLGFIYWSTAAYMEQQTDDTIRAEITGLAERYQIASLNGLVHSINERLKRNPYGSTIYLLTDPRYRRISGNLDGWPSVTPSSEGWVEFPLEQIGVPDQKHQARARIFVLESGFHLLVGRDMYELRTTQALIKRTLISGVLITALLALGGGVMMTHSTVRRIETINATSRDIMRGDLSQRIPTRGTSDDFDQLAENLNTMLDQIQLLMDGVRHVSDNIAHDLKTPLTRLRNRLENLSLESSQHNEALYQQAQHALAEADAMLSTFNALLRIARIEAGARRAAFNSIDLSAVVNDVVELYEPLAEDRQQQLSIAVDKVKSIQGDRDLLFQAFTNLLDNAIKYSPQGSAISVNLNGDITGCRFEIRDSGPGILPEDRHRVLQRFVRLENSRSTPGNGLGLSLVAAVTKLHGATITLDSAEPGLVIGLEFPAARL